MDMVSASMLEPTNLARPHHHTPRAVHFRPSFTPLPRVCFCSQSLPTVVILELHASKLCTDILARPQPRVERARGMSSMF